MASIINVEQIEAKNNTISTSQNTSLDLSGSTAYLGIPGGNTAARGATPPSPAVRFNDDANNIEIYDGVSWKYGKRYSDFNTIPSGGLLLNLDACNPDSYPGDEIKWYDSTFNPYFARFNNVPNYPSNFYFNIASGTHATFEIPTGNAYFLPQNSITQECYFRLSGTNPFSSSTTLTLANIQNGIAAGKSINLSLDQTNGWTAGVRVAGTFETITVPFSNTPVPTGQWFQFVHSYTSQNVNVDFTADVTTGTAILQNVSSLDNLYVGMSISGYGFTSGAIIQSINTNTNEITVDVNSTDTDVERDFTAVIPAGNYIYVNGVLVGTSTLATPGAIEYDTANNNFLTLGMAYEGSGNNTGVAKPFNGFLSAYRIYSTFYKIKDAENNLNAMRERYSIT